MINQTPWFERKFNFDFPLGYLPVIIERLRGTAARLEAMTRGLTQETLTVQLDGKWSILDEIGHLHDLDELHDARLDDFLDGKAQLRPADLQNKKTTAANHNARRLAELIEMFRLRRLELVKRLEGIDESNAARTALHPRLNQPMRLADMAFFVAEHDDHHITRIRGIINRRA